MPPRKTAAKPAAKTTKAATPAAPKPAARKKATPTPPAITDALVARVARAIAKADPNCVIPAIEITDETVVPMDGHYATLARAALSALDA